MTYFRARLFRHSIRIGLRPHPSALCLTQLGCPAAPARGVSPPPLTLARLLRPSPWLVYCAPHPGSSTASLTLTCLLTLVTRPRLSSLAPRLLTLPAVIDEDGAEDVGHQVQGARIVAVGQQSVPDRAQLREAELTAEQQPKHLTVT